MRVGSFSARNSWALTSFAFFLIALMFSWAVVLAITGLGLPTTMWTIVAITFGPTVAGGDAMQV
jgi:hypothetical protein